jgi:hypothetical protein
VALRAAARARELLLKADPPRDVALTLQHAQEASRSAGQPQGKQQAGASGSSDGDDNGSGSGSGDGSSGSGDKGAAAAATVRSLYTIEVAACAPARALARRQKALLKAARAAPNAPKDVDEVVTVPRAEYEALKRRAAANVAKTAEGEAGGGDTITVSRAEHEAIKQQLDLAARQIEQLLAALAARGGEGGGGAV